MIPINKEKSSFMESCTKYVFIFFVLFASVGGAVFAADTSSELTTQARAKYAPIHLTLQQAIDLALKANRGLTSSTDAVESSRISVRSAESDFEVKFVPSVNSSVSGSEDDTDTDPDTVVEAAVEKKFALGPKSAIIPRFEHSDDGSPRMACRDIRPAQLDIAQCWLVH